ncbi:MAG: L,D-transpeptidase, partial [Bacilli bacterium]|nr:L,D-transpeptidase [Bacilli bacterium]
KGNINIDLHNSVIQPHITKNILNDLLNEINYKIDITIKINLENKKTIIEPSRSDKIKWIAIDYKNKKIAIDKKGISSYLEKINNNYINNEKGTADIYQAAYGKINLVAKGQPITGVDIYATTAKIYDAMRNNYVLNIMETAVPITKAHVEYKDHPSSDNSFVEISIGAQQLYLYQDGKLIYTANIVTGKPGGRTDTPQGNFTIMYKTTNFTMKGADYGYDYELDVSYWMPFENGGGAGLHDAPWRSYGSFGGSYYLSSGSHGCVNMRLADAAFVYHHISAGSAVWIH